MTATFYGIFGANFLFLPVAGKLNVYAQEEVFLEELMIEGILAIQSGDNPRIVEEKLISFMTVAELCMAFRLLPITAAILRESQA